MREITMAYGARGMRVRLNEDWQAEVIRKPAMPTLADPAAAIESSLDAPVGAPPLAQLAASARRVCIVICDVTRPVSSCRCWCGGCWLRA